MTEEGTFVYGEREYRLHTNEALTYDEAEVSCAAQSGQIARCAQPRRLFSCGQERRKEKETPPPHKLTISTPDRQLRDP
jgi:hypothetical protein